jgi:hypothetical protein
LPLTAQGVIAVVAGFVLLTAPAPSLRTIEVVLGVALLAYAAFELVELVRGRDVLERSRTLLVIVALAGGGTVLTGVADDLTACGPVRGRGSLRSPSPSPRPPRSPRKAGRHPSVISAP